MCPDTIVVPRVVSERPPQVRFTENDCVIEAFTPDGADDTLDVSILPRRSWCNGAVSDSYRIQAPFENLTVAGIPVSNQVPRRGLPRKRLADLIGDPGRSRMIGGVRPDEFTPRQVKDHQPVQQLEACRWHHKQIDCRDGIFMVVYERPPALPAGAGSTAEDICLLWIGTHQKRRIRPVLALSD